MTVDDFLDYTPREYFAIQEAYYNNKKQSVDMFAMGVYGAVGMSLGGKKFKPIFSEATKKQTKVSEAKEGFKDILDMFND